MTDLDHCKFDLETRVSLSNFKFKGDAHLFLVRAEIMILIENA